MSTNTKLIQFIPFLFMLACTVPQMPGQEYLGAKYQASPLGEGYGYDPDPLIRDDAFDCMTFVETSLAGGNVDKLNKIRYVDGQPDFMKRNHFAECDWLENNADLLENVSSQYGVTATRIVTIDKKSWFKKIYNIDTNFESQTIQLEYIPYSELKSINNLEPLVVLFVVGKSKKIDIIGTDLAVSHMGFVLPGGKILRHASSDHECVMDTDFENYNAKRAKNSNNLGIVLVKIK